MFLKQVFFYRVMAIFRGIDYYEFKSKIEEEIKKAILEQLKQKECSLRELETKTNTGYTLIKRHCQELEFLKIIELIRHKKSDANGRPYTTIRLNSNVN